MERTFLTYLSITIFCYLFSRIYEHFSYGEFSFFMHYLFYVPLIGGGALLLLHLLTPLSRLSYHLWNAGIATITTGFLLRGIINLSGRSTQLDRPYWYVGASLLIFSLLTLLWVYKKKASLSL